MRRQAGLAPDRAQCPFRDLVPGGTGDRDSPGVSADDASEATVTPDLPDELKAVPFRDTYHLADLHDCLPLP